MTYVDGYVLSVPKAKLNAYKKLARLAAKVWKKHGALQYFECAGDDLNPKWATLKFPKMAKAKRGEVVLFSFIIFKSKAHRDKINAKVMKDPLMNDPDCEKNAPFDIKRMAYGGFKAIVQA